MQDIWSSPEEKKALRRALKHARAGEPYDVRAQKDRLIALRLTQLQEFVTARTIFVYYSVGAEVATHSIISKALDMGKIVTLPRVTASHEMEAVRYTGGAEELIPAFQGIPEPAVGQVYAPQEIDFAVVPCLACAENGIRLGYGGGFYDCWLQCFQGMSAVLCREQFLCASLPEEPHDVKVRRIVTERRTIRSDGAEYEK